jgi:hypothetical protein
MVAGAVALGLGNAAANLWKAPAAWSALSGSLIGYELGAMLLVWAFTRWSSAMAANACLWAGSALILLDQSGMERYGHLYLDGGIGTGLVVWMAFGIVLGAILFLTKTGWCPIVSVSLASAILAAQGVLAVVIRPYGATGFSYLVPAVAFIALAAVVFARYRPGSLIQLAERGAALVGGTVALTALAYPVVYAVIR